jgi:hypothetical protein
MDGLEHLALHQSPEPQARCGSVSAAMQIALARHGQGWDHGYFGGSALPKAISSCLQAALGADAAGRWRDRISFSGSTRQAPLDCLESFVRQHVFLSPPLGNALLGPQRGSVMRVLDQGRVCLQRVAHGAGGGGHGLDRRLRQLRSPFSQKRFPLIAAHRFGGRALGGNPVLDG